MLQRQRLSFGVHNSIVATPRQPTDFLRLERLLLRRALSTRRKVEAAGHRWAFFSF
jgi:hypothetical protein